MNSALYDITVPEHAPSHRGKVRSVYEAGDRFVIVASDRVSAYDVVLPTPVPDKGRVLTQLSAFWFRTLESASPHHLITTERAEMPEPFRDAPELEGRAMLCRRARVLPVECIVRGYLTGSGLREYRAKGSLHGEPLPPGLEDGSRLDPPRFTPTTKAAEGHDEPLTWDEFRGVVGDELAVRLRERSLAIFREATPIAERAGLRLADTKFELGWVDGELTLVDECLSPDASRFWDAAAHDAGRLEAFDKQRLRNWLDRSGWNHEPPAPELPDGVVRGLRDRYLEAAHRLMGAEEARRAGIPEPGA